MKESDQSQVSDQESSSMNSVQDPDNSSDSSHMSPEVQDNQETPGQIDSTTEQPEQEISPFASRTMPRQATTTVAMYRLYNPNNYEHFYTADVNEAKTLLTIGWGEYEGIGWFVPNTGQAVYRLYQPNLKDHHYTTSENERNVLVAQHGWQYEGIAWYSDASKSIPVYRAFHPSLTSGSHNYTRDRYEQSVLTTQRGWIDEGIGWYGSNIVPQSNQDDFLRDISNGLMGIKNVRFDLVSSVSRKNWLDQTIRSSVPLAKKGNVFPSVMVAQAILESDWGESGLTIRANNLFGLTKGTWTGAVYNVPTAEMARKDGNYSGYRTQAEAQRGVAPYKMSLKEGDYYWVIGSFRKYGSQQQSLVNYIEVMSQRGYDDARRPIAKSYKDAAIALGDDKFLSWVTDLKYTKNIISVIEYYNLKSLD